MTFLPFSSYLPKPKKFIRIFQEIFRLGRVLEKNKKLTVLATKKESCTIWGEGT